MFSERFEESLERLDREMEFLKETLFIAIAAPDPAWHFNARLDLMPKDWDHYATGYKEIADAVMNKLAEMTHVPDYLAFPIVFLYLHYLELRLKELLIGGSSLQGERRNIPPDHRLLPLWKRVRPMMEQLWNDQRSLTFHDDIERRLEEFEAVDPGSFAFRYPEDTKGGPSLMEPRMINLKRVRDVVTAISHVLDGASTGIYENNRAKAEMMAEYQDDMRYYDAPGF